ncbi:MAG: TetR/AcrR family transcriptional regulator [Bacilli bacterium]|nr:TetR/AcrR family transcriptional regulator [Bacilli bacterium]MEE3343707.1 TetR/AcrR family transcriptional regulator [Bacilli bacterium]
MKKEDLRIVKTKKALYNALINLMKKKTFEEIKVSDICDEALINRSTFYTHFEDKYTLLSNLLDNLKQSFIGELDKNIYTNSKEYYIEVIKIFLTHIEKEKDTYLSIAINNRNSILTDMIYDVIDNDVLTKLKNDENLEETKIPKTIISKFFIGAVVNVGIYWLYNIDKYSKNELIDYLIKLIPDEIK